MGFDTMTRTSFLRDFVHARIQKLDAPLDDETTARATLFCQRFEFFSDTYSCPGCGEQLTLESVKESRSGCVLWRWRGPQYDDACSACIDKKSSVAKSTLLERVPSSLWLQWLEALNMWWLEYPRSTTYQELGLNGHTTVNR